MLLDFIRDPESLSNPRLSIGRRFHSSGRGTRQGYGTGPGGVSYADGRAAAPPAYNNSYDCKRCHHRRHARVCLMSKILTLT